MNSDQAPRSGAELARLARQGASPTQVADALLDTWTHLHDALAPIVGMRGVAALYSRAMHVTVKAHPWLAAALSSAGTVDPAPLRAAMLTRPSAESAMAGDAFLHNFAALLSSLVGQSLADHLIGPLRTETPSGDAAQDP